MIFLIPLQIIVHKVKLNHGFLLCVHDDDHAKFERISAILFLKNLIREKIQFIVKYSMHNLMMFNTSNQLFSILKLLIDQFELKVYVKSVQIFIPYILRHQLQ